jgi:hypothetical protein
MGWGWALAFRKISVACSNPNPAAPLAAACFFQSGNAGGLPFRKEKTKIELGLEKPTKIDFSSQRIEYNGSS